MKKRNLPILGVALMIALAMASCGGQADNASPANSTSVADSAAGLENVRVSSIDVGKGDCILVQSGSSFALIDTGYEKTSDEVLSYLRKQGVRHLDALVLTHFDKDHVGGFRPIAKAFDVDTVYLPGYEGGDKHYTDTVKTARDLKLSTRLVTDEVHLELGKAQMTIYPAKVPYAPDAKGDEGNDNDASMVATLHHGKDSYLFAADLEEEGVDAYLRDNHGRFDVVKMPHHGEKGDNTEDFLDDVQPKIAIITDGLDRLVSKKTLKYLEKRDVDTYCSSVDGTVAVTSDGAGNYTVATNVG